MLQWSDFISNKYYSNELTHEKISFWTIKNCRKNSHKWILFTRNTKDHVLKVTNRNSNKIPLYVVDCMICMRVVLDVQSTTKEIEPSVNTQQCSTCSQYTRSSILSHTLTDTHELTHTNHRSFLFWARWERAMVTFSILTTIGIGALSLSLTRYVSLLLLLLLLWLICINVCIDNGKNIWYWVQCANCIECMQLAAFVCMKLRNKGLFKQIEFWTVNCNNEEKCIGRTNEKT